MPSLQATRRSSTLKRQGRLSTLFWGLARGSGEETNAADPVAVVKHLLASVAVLQGTSDQPSVSADALTFLLQLEKDPYYASPEQIRGGDKDSQGLVYSVGVLLFERLTGHHPFVESLSPMQCAVARDRSTRVGKNNLCSLPKRLRDMLQRAMSPFPEDRWDDLTSFAESLQQFVEHHKTIMKPLEWRRGLGSAPELPRLTTMPNTPRALAFANTEVLGHAPTQPLRVAPTHVDRVAPTTPGHPTPRPPAAKHVAPTLPPPPIARRSAPIAKPIDPFAKPTAPCAKPTAPFAKPTAPFAKPGPRARRKSAPPPCPGSKERQAFEDNARIAAGSAPKPQPERPATVEISPIAFVPSIAPLAAPRPPEVTTALLDINLRRKPRIARLAVVGAAVFATTVLIATNVMGPSDTRANASAPAAPASVDAPASAAAATPAQPSAVDTRDEPETAIVTRPAAAPAPVPEVKSIAPAPFDAEVGGKAALAAIRPCYTAVQLRRGMQLDVSLRYSSKTGLSDQVYFGTTRGLHPGQRSCLSRALVGLSAGAAPARGTIATYTFWLSTSTERQRVHKRK